jgi:MFS transporter, DHA1 family, staphyloferrin A biosynthesis exporter
MTIDERSARGPATEAPAEPRDAADQTVHDRQNTTHAPRLSGPLTIFSSLQHRDYRFLWIGTLFLSAGQWIQQVTLGWLLYELSGSPVLLGAMHAVRALPFLFIGPFAGVAADRFDRRGILLVTVPIMIVACVLMGLLVASGWLDVWHILAFSAFTAVIWAVNNPVRQTLVPNLVPRRDLMNAIALNSAGFNSQKVIGPAIGGVLIAAMGPAENFYVQSLSYGMVLFLFTMMRVPPTPSDARKQSVASNFREGLVYVRRDPMLLAMLIAALVPPLFSLPVTMAMLPVFQKDVYGVGPEGLGALMAGPGFGAVIATLGLASISHRVQRQGLLMLIDLVLLGLAMMVFSQAPSLPLAVIALVGVGIFQMAFFTLNHTLLQSVVPDELRGRVNAIFMADHGLGPAGSLLAGVLTQVIGAPATVAMFGAIVIALAGLLAWRSPNLLNAGLGRASGH